MKLSEFARSKGYSAVDVEKYLTNSSHKFKTTLLGDITFDDSIAPAVAAGFEKWRAEKTQKEAAEKARMQAEKEQAMLEEKRKKRALASMLITSGFSFDGYTIKKYSGYISGDDVVQIERGTSGIFASATNVGGSLSRSLVEIRRNALAELKEAAYDLGCNAVIGVDFDYITLEPETASSTGGTMYLPYVFCVTANGNAVVIEKNE